MHRTTPFASMRKALICLLLLGAAGCSLDHKLDEPALMDTVAEVNGEPIAYGELAHYLEAYRSRVYTYFRDKYGAEDSAAFWTTKYDGEVPAEMLNKLAMDSSVSRKIQQIAAKEQGLAGDISYRGLLQDLRKVNAVRQEKVNNHEVIYGPITYDEQRYFDERLLSLQRDLMERLKDDFNITKQEAADYYEKNKQQFSLGDARRIQGIEVSFSTEQEREEKIDSARDKLESIKKRIDSGIGFEVIYDELMNNHDELLAGSEKVYDDNMPRTEAIAHPLLISEISKLDEGQTTDVIEGADFIGIFNCSDKFSLGDMSKEKAMSDIVGKLTKIKYEESVNRWVADAKIEIVKNK